MPDDADRPTTPPTSPKYGVYLSDFIIGSIVERCLPHIHSGFSITQLRSDQSLYNRIYFIDSTSGESFVLKVSGRVTGKPRIENEVSCLLLLQHFCPTIPVPKPVAWSRGGREISSLTAGGIQTGNLSIVGEGVPAWLLMTRLPGKELDVSKLSSEQVSSVATQLAEIVSSWRQSIPQSPYAGNLNLYRRTVLNTEEDPKHGAVDAGVIPVYVFGLLGSGTGFESPMESWLSFLRTALEYEVQKLQTKPTLMRSRNSSELPSLIAEFIQCTLPHLSIFNASSERTFKFTHTDFAPRNVLVSQADLSVVTGIIDFEFAGFFPSTLEFFPEIVNLPRPQGIGLGAEGDWPQDMYFHFLQELEKRGEVTPLELFKRKNRVWEELLALQNLEVFIAPPILAKEEAEVLRLLEYSRKQVLEALETLINLTQSDRK